MRRITKLGCAVLLVVVFLWPAVARANSALCGVCTNQQAGDNGTSKSQDGDSTSGDAIGGQVVGIVSSGIASVDAKNRSERVDVTTGDATGENNSQSFAGLNDAASTTITDAGLVFGGVAFNQQNGDNDFALTQTATATSGDGVAGQVIGVVTSAGGSAKVVSDNGSKRIDLTTGDADSENESSAFVGLDVNNGDPTNVLAPPNGNLVIGAGNATALLNVNQQIGDNSVAGDQTATSTSGDAVGGQVLGVVSAGKASLDAKNRSERIDITTGEATAENSNAAFVGLNAVNGSTTIRTDGIALSVFAVNQQNGDNTGNFTATSEATSGDGVAGQVAGIVTSAGGSVDSVLDNGSLRIDATTGPATMENRDSLFVGLNFSFFDLTIR